MELKLDMRKFSVFFVPVFLLACLSIYVLKGTGFDRPEPQPGQPVGSATAPPSQLLDVNPLGPKIQTFTDDQAWLDFSDDTSADEVADTQGTSQLLAALEDKAGQGLSYEALRDGEEFQRIMAQLQSDPAARQQVLAQVMKFSGTPLGKTLSLALATSGVAVSMPKLKTAAVQLLRKGSEEQRLDALQLLGATASYDAPTRAGVLDVLRGDGAANSELAVAAMANLVKQSGGASPAEQQEIVKAVYPFVGSGDPQLRLNGLQVLSTLAGSDPDAQRIFAEGVNDADPDVRRWVIAAMGNGEFAYDSVREPLLATLQNPDEDPAVKAVAQRALERFPLDEQAQQIYQEHLASESYQAPTGGFGFN